MRISEDSIFDILWFLCCISLTIISVIQVYEGSGIGVKYTIPFLGVIFFSVQELVYSVSSYIHNHNERGKFH